MITFKKNYFALAILLFLIELFIALFIRDKFIRPYFGDVLVVILIYCFIKSFIGAKVFIPAAGVLIFSFIIEFLQYLNIVEKLGWQNSSLANTVLGNYFSWKDIMAYIAGFLIVIGVEKHSSLILKLIVSPLEWLIGLAKNE